MGEGEEVKTRPDPPVHIQERGEIFFFYRPKVNTEDPHSISDVQRLYIVLLPESGDHAVEEKQSQDSGKEGKKTSVEGAKSPTKKGDERGSEGGHGSQKVNIEKQSLFRFIVMGKKSLPDPSKRSTPYWGFVEMVTTDAENIKNGLKAEEYETATRGHRQKPSARAVGEGVYRIVKHEAKKGRTHTHLIYKLELPAETARNEPQESLNIEREGSFIIQIKNPEETGGGRGSDEFRGLKSKRQALFPAHLQARLGHLRFAPAEPPDFLNYEGCEFLLISASDHIDDELGLQLKVEQESGSGSDQCSDLVEMFGEMVPSKSLLSGVWC